MKIAAVIAALLASLFATPPAQAAEPTRIMLLGDSVTHGLSGEYTWRYFAWKGLQQTGATVDFVGPHVGTWSKDAEFGGTYAAPDFDTDHASRYGLSMWETLYWNSNSAPSIAQLMASDPDVIVNTLGINDLIGVNQTPEEAIGHSRKIIEQARAINPDVDFVLGSLPQVWFERVPVYNNLLPALAAELSTAESRVVVTPTAKWNNGVDTYDDAHPTTLGQRKIAEAVSVGLSELGIGRPVLMPDPTVVQPQPEPVTPEPTTAPEPVVTPTPAPTAASLPAAPQHVKATRVGRRVVVRWSGDADFFTVACGTKRTDTVVDRAVVRTSAARCKVRAVNAAGKSPWVVAPVTRRR